MAWKELQALTPKICELVSKGLHKTQIAKKLGVSPSKMHRFFSKLEASGVIEREFKSSFVKYKVKQNFIFPITYREGKSYRKFFRFHHFLVKFPIIRDSKLPYDKVLNLKSGKQFFYKSKRFGWSVRKTRKNVVISLNKPLFGFFPKELKERAWREVGAVKFFLENRFGLVLGEGVQVGKEHVACEDFLAERFHRENKLFENSSMVFDNSIKDSGELDWKSAELADAYSEMPFRVERMEKFILEHFFEFNRNIELHLGVLTEIRSAIIELRRVLSQVLRQNSKNLLWEEGKK